MKKKDVTTKFKEIKKTFKSEKKHQGLTIEEISKLLSKLEKNEDSYRDYVWSMLDDKLINIYSEDYKFCDGACVAHSGAYSAILMHDKEIKKDREKERKDITKYLLSIGALEKVTFVNSETTKLSVKKSGFYEGHLVQNSPNLCYRLTENFVELLKKTPNLNFDSEFNQWIKKENNDKRLELIAKTEIINVKMLGESLHKKLIALVTEIYIQDFLVGYEIIHIDFFNGKKLTFEEKKKLENLGIVFGGRGEVRPDLMLYNQASNKLWFVEAVTSTGEVDESKMEGYKKICKNSNIEFGGATTAYLNYKMFYKRQEKNENLARNTYVWIAKTPDKIFKIE